MATPIWSDKYNKWRYRVTINGKTKNFTSIKKGLAGKREVLAKARQFEFGTDTKEHTIAEYYDKFMQANIIRLGEKSESVKQYEKFGRLYILPALGNRKPKTIRKQEWQDIIDNAKPQDTRTKVLSKKYLSNIRMAIMVFLRWCDNNEYFPIFKGELYIPHDRPTKGKDILQPKQIERLFEPSPLWYHRAICFCLCCGLRPSECLGLTWDNVFEDHIDIVQGVTTSGEISQGKTINALRSVPLTTVTSELLEEQRKATEALQSEYVFCSILGGVGSQSTMGNHYRELKEERDLSGSLYSLRHTFVSMVKNSMSESLCRTVIGHSSSMESYATYGAHKVDGELKQAAEIMDLTFKKLAK